MVGFSTIAMATAATVSAVGTISSASAQSKAAKKAAAADEANAQAAEQNAEALAEAVEGTTKFNYTETVRDADLTKQRTLLELEQIARTQAFALGQIDRETRATRNKADQETTALSIDAAARQRAIALKLGALDATAADQSAAIDMQRAHGEQLLVLRGDALKRDTADEIARIMGEADYERGALNRQAGQALSEAALAVTAVREKAAFDAMEARTQATDATASAAFSTRQAAAETVMALREERRQRAQATRTLGAARAAAAAGGVAVSGSTLDVLADTRAEAEMAALTTRYEGALRADGFLEDARSKTVKAGLLTRQADQAERMGALDARTIEMKANFEAAELRAKAGEVGRRATEGAGTIARRSAEQQAEYDLQWRQNAETAALDQRAAAGRTSEARALLLSDRQHERESASAALDAIRQQAGDRLADLDASRAQTDADYSVMHQTTKLDGEEQEAALRREADMIQWKGEIDARNTRLTGYQQAAEYRTSAAARRSQAGSIMTAGLFNAGATLISGAGQVYSSWGGSGRSGNNGSGR